MATVCYGIVPVLKKFGTDNGGPPVLGALVMHATGLLLLVTLGSLLKIEFKPERIAASSVVCFVARGFSLRHRFDHDPQGVDLRAGLGGGAGLERSADRQFLPGEDHAQRHRSGELARWFAALLVVLGVLVLRLGINSFKSFKRSNSSKRFGESKWR